MSKPAKVMQRLTRSFRSVPIHCRMCNATAEGGASTTRADGMNIGPFVWLSLPAGWWVYLPPHQLELDDLHARCAECASRERSVVKLKTRSTKKEKA